jgi:multidrug efflux pump subunit AcrA (membrane-fusion protein)
VVPATAVFQENGKYYVILVRDDGKVRHEVRPGYTSNDFTEILEGLKGGEIVNKEGTGL